MVRALRVAENLEVTTAQSFGNFRTSALTAVRRSRYSFAALLFLLGHCAAFLLICMDWFSKVIRHSSTLAAKFTRNFLIYDHSMLFSFGAATVSI